MGFMTTELRFDLIVKTGVPYASLFLFFLFARSSIIETTAGRSPSDEDKPLCNGLGSFFSNSFHQLSPPTEPFFALMPRRISPFPPRSAVFVLP